MLLLNQHYGNFWDCYNRLKYTTIQYFAVSNKLWNGNGGSDRKTGGKNGSRRVENGEVGTGSDKKGQDKKPIHERDCENRKARRQTSECKATLVWTREKQIRRLRGKNDDGDGGAR